MAGQVGMLLIASGQWIGSPRTLWLLLTAVFVLIVLIGMTLVRRDVVRARAFLETHPAPEVSAA